MLAAVVCACGTNGGKKPSDALAGDGTPTTDNGGTSTATGDADTTADTGDDSDAGVELCANDADCDDDLFCNGVETCAPEALESAADGCVAGIAPKGTDPDPVDCQVLGACDEESESFPVVVLAAGDSCDDGIACTTADVCDESGGCKGTPDDTRCDDGLFCTGVESCNTVIGCLTGAAPKGADPDPTDCLVPGPCEEATRAFTQVPAEVGKACDDAVDCTFEDGCTGAGTCEGKPNDGFCTNDAFCDGVELCDVASGGCIDGPDALPPQDLDPLDCMVYGACDEAADGFSLGPAGVGVACDDGVACTASDACNVVGGCAGVASDALCDDGNFCTGVETCDPVQGGCQPGAPPTAPQDPNTDDCLVYDPVCDATLGGFKVVPAGFGDPCSDGVSCTTETCDAAGTCLAIADDAGCIDANVCNGTETCDLLLGCQPGVAKVCNDNSACNGVETCSPLVGCVDGTPTPPDDPDSTDCLVVSEQCNEALGDWEMVPAQEGVSCFIDLQLGECDDQGVCVPST